MNVLIIGANTAKNPMPVMPAGACMVAEAAERAGHNVRLLDLMFEKDLPAAVKKEIKRYPPDAIGISVRNIDNNDMPAPRAFYKDVLQITREIRAVSTAPVILGGTAVGIMPTAYLKLTGAEGAVIGPGEHVFPQILNDLKNNLQAENIRGLFTLKNGLTAGNYPDFQFDAGVCGVPDFKRWLGLNTYMSHLASIPLQTKRGCAFNCIYCTYGMCEGSRLQVTAPQAVVNQVIRLTGQGYKDIEFVDAVFNYPYDHTLELCNSLAEARTGARFQTYNLNPQFINSPLLDAMERAGFCGIGVSAESGSDKVLKGLKKNYSLKQLEFAAKAISHSRLPCFWMFILGGPGETEETVEKTFAFAKKYVRSKDALLFSMGLRIYPGTGLETLARSEGVLNVPADEMLEPVTYISPLVNPGILADKINHAVKTNLNYVSSSMMQSNFINKISPLIHFSGLGKPMWKHTGFFRGTLKLIGADI